MDKEKFDFERFKEEAIKGLYEGKKMGGTDGLFAPMLKHLLESMLEGELDHHLKENKASGEINRKNGKAKKQLGAFSRATLNWRVDETGMVLLSQRLSRSVNLSSQKSWRTMF